MGQPAAVHPRRAPAVVGVLVLAPLVLSALGCVTPIGVTRADPRAVHRTLSGNVLSTGEPSVLARNVLQRYGLDAMFDDAPDMALEMLRERVNAGTTTRGAVYGLAELYFYHAARSHSRAHYLASALWAYAYVFPEKASEAVDPLDPRMRWASDLYNRALTAAFEAKDEDATLVELEAGTFPLPFGELVVEFDPQDLVWRDRRFVELVPVAELKVRGLRSRYRQPGIGAPLAASTVLLDESAEVLDIVSADAKVPVTAFLRIERPREQLKGTVIHGTLELHVPFERDHVEIGGNYVPLEMEPSAALAATFAEPAGWKREIWGFLQRIGAVEEKSRLTALAPYHPGKFPVVFVHGTASSAGRWAEMTNDLENDGRINDRFQFWYFHYDTGNPISYSAMLLRQSLTDAVARLDPHERDAALRRMVVIGHSQGGLLAKMTAVDSGDQFWRNVSKKPFAETRMNDETRQLLERALFFDPLPFVARVVYIATPQRGSYVAGNRVSHWVSRFINMPLNLVGVMGDLARGNAELYQLGSLRHPPSSIDNMTPGSPFIRVLSSLQVAPGVATHSIIAVKGDGPFERGDDGIVKYESAHVNGAESELVVRSAHSCQARAETIQEVRRILVEHAEEAEPEVSPDRRQRVGSDGDGGRRGSSRADALRPMLSSAHMSKCHARADMLDG
jgi:pimeloyl-ACP methyl ester carboxylesterase